MANTENTFSIKRKGYDPAEVEDCLGKLKAEIAEKDGKITALTVELASMEKMYDKLIEKLNEVQNEKSYVAKVLVDAEKRAGEILADAVREGNARKDSLYEEADAVKEKIYGSSELLRTMQNFSRTYVEQVVENLRNSADAFEQEIYGKLDAFLEDTDRFIRDTEDRLENDPVDSESSAEEVLEAAETPEGEIPEDFAFEQTSDAAEYFSEADGGTAGN